MKYPASYYKILFLVITMIGLFVSCTGKKSKTEKSVELELSKAGQVYQWSETEGQAFLSHMRNTYTTAEAWKKRAKEIRTQILLGAELVPFPEKCPLNPIMGEKRVYDGYQVQNAAFESLPGVYVTGSIYSPVNAESKLPGVLSPHSPLFWASVHGDSNSPEF